MGAWRSSLKVGLVLLAGALAFAGSTRGDHSAYASTNIGLSPTVTNNLPFEAQTNDPLAEADQRLRQLCESASAVFRVDVYDGIGMNKPARSEAVAWDKVKELLRDKNVTDRGLAVVIVPGYEMVKYPEMRTEEETEVEVNEELQKAGFKRIVFLTHINGFLLTEAYPDGLSTREELRKHKEYIRKTYPAATYGNGAYEHSILGGIEGPSADKLKKRADEPWFETSARVWSLWNSASAAFEFDSELSVKLVRPSSSEPVPIAKIGNLLREKNITDRKLAALRIWSESSVDPEHESQEEVMIKTVAQLKKLGFGRVAIVTERWASILFVGYNDELSTLEEARRIRKSVWQPKPQATISTTNRPSTAK
jgi:hypothetical protein